VELHKQAKVEIFACFFLAFAHFNACPEMLQFRVLAELIPSDPLPYK
jgi:hypothetical protein